MTAAARLQHQLSDLYGARSAERICTEIDIIRPVNATLAPHVANDGTESLMVCLDILLPILNLGRQYHLPLKFWFPLGYPAKPPVIFVDPIPGMQLSRSHPNLQGTDGLVSTAYLSSWNARTSSVPALLSELSQLFGRIPPLFSVAQTRSTPTISQTPPPSSRPSGAELRAQLNRVLMDRVQLLREVSVADHDEDIAAGQRLISDNQNLLAIFGELDDVEQQMSASFMLFGHALCRRPATSPPPALPSTDELLRPADGRSARLLAAVAADHAYGDLIYQLEKAFGKGLFPPDVFIRLVKDAARSQFYEKALAQKIVRMAEHA